MGSKLKTGACAYRKQVMLEGPDEVSCDSSAHLADKSRFEVDSLHFSII